MSQASPDDLGSSADPLTEAGLGPADGSGPVGAVGELAPLGPPLSKEAAGPAAPLVAWRFEVPCIRHKSPEACRYAEPFAPGAPKRHSVETEMGGKSDTHYTVTLRVRGVVEDKPVLDGRRIGPRLVENGTFKDGGSRNSFVLEVAEPKNVYFLNPLAPATDSSNAGFAIDYAFSLVIRGQSAIELAILESGNNPNILTNRDEVVVPDIPPAPMPFDGMFVQVDVLAVSERR